MLRDTVQLLYGCRNFNEFGIRTIHVFARILKPQITNLRAANLQEKNDSQISWEFQFYAVSQQIQNLHVTGWFTPQPNEWVRKL